jgi:flagellar biosynthesis protein FlhB
VAGDKHAKTEKPTPRRKKEARQRGQVPRSPDLGIWVTVLVGSFVIPVVFRRAYTTERTFVLGSVQSAISNPDPAGALSVLGHGLQTVVVTVAPVLIAAVITAIAVNLAQTGLAFRKFKVDASRLNPRNGIKRLLSPQGLFNLLRSLLKIVILAALAYWQFKTLGPAILQAGCRPPAWRRWPRKRRWPSSASSPASAWCSAWSTTACSAGASTRRS